MIILDNLSLPTTTIKVVRDDLYPFVGGGNKARKALYYERYMIEHGLNAIVTTGGVQSNHNRAMAVIASRNNWPCHLVVHGSEERFDQESGNPKLIRALRGITTEFVSVDKISSSMDDAISRYKEQGYNPLYVTGGGHDLIAGYAYVDAVSELLKASSEASQLKYVFLALGTGSTVAGISAGLELAGLDTTVVGVSIARKKERATDVTMTFAQGLYKEMNLSAAVGNIIITDEYLCGGYEGSTPEMTQWIDNVIARTGVFFDYTYSGKALWGAYNYITKHKIDPSEVLFWHTGGLMNYLATP